MKLKIILLGISNYKLYIKASIKALKIWNYYLVRLIILKYGI